MNHFEFREIENDRDFNPNSLYSDAPFTQASFYGNWQKSLGRLVRRFLVYRDEKIVCYYQLIKYPLLFNKSYFYIPYGPVTNDFSEYFFSSLKRELKRISKKENVAFVRLDFTPPVSSNILSTLFTKSPFYTYHSAYFQPRSEWCLRLGKSKTELLTSMHEKTRYSIRLAERKGITAEIVVDDFQKYFDIFYELMAETARRNGFRLHEKNYYKKIFDNLSTIENSYLSIAKYGERILAINLIVVFGGVANYVFGGSSSDERNRMPTYLAHWKAICQAKRLNCISYNFGGISTGNKIYSSWDDLTNFKKKFGGEEMKHSEFYDVVVYPLWYHLYNFRKYIKQFGL